MLRKILGLFINNGEYHKFYSDPEDGPSYECYPDCKKCLNTSNLTGKPLTKLEKALR